MLTTEQKARRDELLAKDKLSDSEKSELDCIETAEKDDAVPVAASDMPDHSPEPMHGETPRVAPFGAPQPALMENVLSDEDRLKLQRFRVRSMNGQLPDEDNAEMERLSLQESEAAGHTVPDAPQGDRPEDAFMGTLDQIFAAFEHIAATVPAAVGVLNIIRAGRMRLDAFRKHLDGDKDAPTISITGAYVPPEQREMAENRPEAA